MSIHDYLSLDEAVMAALYDGPSKFDGWDETRLIDRQRELSPETLLTAIDRGLILKRLELSKEDYERKNIGITWRHGYRLINLATSPRTYQPGWKRPCSSRACYELVRYDARNGRYTGNITEYRYGVPERIFKELTQPQENGLALIGYHTSRKKVLEAIAACRKRLYQPPAYSLPPAKQTQERPAVTHLNQIVHGDCFKLIPQLTDSSIALVVTSPPYAEHRSQYEGIREADYPRHMVELMTALRPKLTEDGSVIIIIRSHVRDGQVSRYVHDTITAIWDAGWYRPDESIWYKPDDPPLGATYLPRRNFEHILWFSKIKPPYMDLLACGRRSDCIGMVPANPHGNLHSDGETLEDGIARVTDVITAPVSGDDKGTGHPAVYPPELVRPLIRTFAPPGSVILDPFCGSGTTCLVAQSEEYDFIGFDNGHVEGTEELYADIAARRLKTEAKYARRKAIRDRKEAQGMETAETKTRRAGRAAAKGAGS